MFQLRLKELREKAHISQVQLAKAIGVAQSTVAMWESGKSSPEYNTLIKISDYFAVGIDFLAGKSSAQKAEKTGSVRIPVLGSVPAGIPLEAVEDILDWEEIPDSMCTGNKEYFALEVHGDSMWPDYLPGDIIIVRKSHVCNSGDVCVVYVNGYDATLKQVIIGEGGSLSLIPKNQSYPPRTYSRREVIDMPISIAGVVVELRRKIRGG